MPRQARKLCESQIYHVIYKGIDNQDIFYNEKDKKFFLEMLIQTKEEFKFEIYAYCLMSNHVHLVIGIKDDFFSKSMKSLSVKYVFYFNKKYYRSGHLFQNRFNSKCVENQKYFLDVCRYVEQNPEKAGICKTEDYKWSSYHEYIGVEEIIDKNRLLHYFNNNIQYYKIFTTKGRSENKVDFIEYELRKKMKDEELAKLIIEEFKVKSISEFKNLPREDLKKGIEILRNLQYTNINQISRVIRINRYQLERYWK